MEKPTASLVTAEKLTETLPTMALATRAIHADDFSSSHRGIAPAMHVAVNYRYDRDPEKLVQGENKDVPLPYVWFGADNLQANLYRLLRIFQIFRTQQQTL